VALGGGAPTQGSGLSPTSKETLALQQAQAQSKIDVEKERQTETNKQAIAVASKASEALQASADSADKNIMIANRITQNVEKVPELVNLLGKEGAKSALLNLVDQGIKTPGGQLSIGGVNELAIQLDPSITRIKDPKVREARLSAAQELARDFAYLALQGSKMVEGQGAVSDNERNLIKQSVGDPSRLTAKNIMNVAKALKYEAMNAKERRDLWNQMSDSGMTYQQFRRSPEYMDQSKKQYARMARILGINDAPPFDPALERS
jgi:cell division ATPase FtsA